ncbi:MAG: TonB family protein, partial [Cyanobacteria bacterium J083]
MLSAPSLVNKIISPNGIAVLASVTFHGLLLSLGLPAWNSTAEELKPGKTVPVIELSALEQSRLPDFSQNTPTIPPFSATDLNSNPLFNLPNLPNTSSNIRQIPLPPPPPQVNSVYPNLPSLPPIPKSSYRTRQYTSSLPQVKYRNIPYLPPYSRNIPLPAPPPIPNSQYLPNQYPPVVILPPYPNNQPSPTDNINPPVKTTTNPVNPNLVTPQNRPSREEFLAKRIEELSSQIRQKSDNLRAKKTNTSNAEADRNYLAWWAKIKTEKQPEFLAIKGVYPTDACPRKLQGSVNYGILVDAEGSVRQISLIKSSGYNIFNLQARETITSRKFANKTGNPKPYLVKVDFPYDNKVCPNLDILPEKTKNSQPKSLSETNSGETQQTEQIKPENNNT